MKNKLYTVLAASLAVSLVIPSALPPVETEARIITNDTHESDGIPAMAVQKVRLYTDRSLTKETSNTIERGTVVRILEGNKIIYNGKILYFNADDFLQGDKLSRYVVKHPDEFDKKVTTTDQTYLYDIDTLKEIAIVAGNTSFIVSGEDDDFYEVMFEDKKALLYKDKAAEELYVKVTAFDDSSETLQSIYTQLKKLADDFNVDMPDSSVPELDLDSAAGGVIVKYALQFTGNPYVWGGNSLTDGCDCSGFVKLVYQHFGVALPRHSGDQANVGTTVGMNELQPGDLLFFSRGAKIGHVAMYAGSGMIVHAKGTKYGIVYEKLGENPVICKRLIRNGGFNSEK